MTSCIESRSANHYRLHETQTSTLAEKSVEVIYPKKILANNWYLTNSAQIIYTFLLSQFPAVSSQYLERQVNIIKQLHILLYIDNPMFILLSTCVHYIQCYIHFMHITVHIFWECEKSLRHLIHKEADWSDLDMPCLRK